MLRHLVMVAGPFLDECWLHQSDFDLKTLFLPQRLKDTSRLFPAWSLQTVWTILIVSPRSHTLIFSAMPLPYDFYVQIYLHQYEWQFSVSPIFESWLRWFKIAIFHWDIGTLSILSRWPYYRGVLLVKVFLRDRHLNSAGTYEDIERCLSHCMPVHHHSLV